MTDFASRLKELRSAAGLTQDELAERAGMNKFGIAKLEQGHREPSWSTIQALCRALSCDCSAFMVEPVNLPQLKPCRPRKPKDAPAPAKKKGTRS